MSSFKLYTYPQWNKGMKALIAANYNNINIETPTIQYADSDQEWYRTLVPSGRIPALVTEEGSIVESNAIARYVAGLRADTGLLGKTYMESAKIDQWLYWATNELDAPVQGLVAPIMGYYVYNKKSYDVCKAALYDGLNYIESHLSSRTFFVGERLTLADIVVAMTLLNIFQLILVKADREKYVNVTRWFLTCMNQKEFIQVAGEIKLAEVEAQAAAPVKAEKEEEKKAEKKEEKKVEKKEEKPKADKKKKDDDDEDFDDTPKDEKPRLSEEEAKWIAAKSTMDLDTVKRTFSNNKYEDVAADFWKDFDYSLYTMWEANYKFNEENVIGWQTGNLVGGVLNRLEEARKIAYGSIVFTALDGVKPFHIQGFFMFKYKAVPTFVTDSADYDSFEYKQVDITTDAGKARMAEFWAADKIDGRLVQERRWLK